MTADISALMDGELEGEETARVLALLRQDEKLSETWATYHLVRDALRRSGPLSLDVSRAVARRLAEEPAVLAPRPQPREWRFSPWALAASLAAVGFVGLFAWQLARVEENVVATPRIELAQGASSPLVVASPPPAARKEKAEEPAKKLPLEAEPYLLAHQEFSPSYAMVGMPAYVRVVAEDTGQ
jgi:sigma-E factor negative regulatory protein RseA